MPYHVRITPKGPSRLGGDELALDLTREELETRFLVPRGSGQPVTVNGRTLVWSEIDRIRISETDASSVDLLPIIRAERAASPVVTTISDQWYVTKRGLDVTSEFITGPPGRATESPASSKGVFHVQLARGWFRVARDFNLNQAEAEERFTKLWRENRHVLMKGRAWSPTECKLTIYQGPRLTTNQLAMSAGWINAVKFGEDVTEEMLSGRMATPPDLEAAANETTTAEAKRRAPTIWGHLNHLPHWLATTADTITVVGALAGAGKLLGFW